MADSPPTGTAYLDDSQIAKFTIERGYDKERRRTDMVVVPF